VNEQITCSAQGYPTPTIRWQQVGHTGARPVPLTTGPVLRVSYEMVGDNTWKCTAVNDVGSTERFISFRVIGIDDITFADYHIRAGND